MNDPTNGLRLRLDTARERWRSDDGAVAVREVIAIMAVAIITLAAALAVLEVAGFDVTDWLREQLGITSSG